MHSFIVRSKTRFHSTQNFNELVKQFDVFIHLNKPAHTQKQLL